MITTNMQCGLNNDSIDISRKSQKFPWIRSFGENLCVVCKWVHFGNDLKRWDSVFEYVIMTLQVPKRLFNRKNMNFTWKTTSFLKSVAKNSLRIEILSYEPTQKILTLMSPLEFPCIGVALSNQILDLNTYFPLLTTTIYFVESRST